MAIKMTRSQVYKQYKELSLKFKQQLPKSWNSSGCTRVWLEDRCSYLVAKYGGPKEPEPEPQPQPQPKEPKLKPKPKPKTKTKPELKNPKAKVPKAKDPKVPKPVPECKVPKTNYIPEAEPDDPTLSAYERWNRAFGRYRRGETEQIRKAAEVLMKEMTELENQEWERKHAEWERKWAASEPANSADLDDLTILGLTEADRGNERSIKRAFHKKALAHHPDKGGDTEVFKRIANAYEALRAALRAA